jgi:hypothetical protein
MVKALGVLRPAADFRYQPALYQRCETSSGGAWRQSDFLGNPGG